MSDEAAHDHDPLWVGLAWVSPWLVGFLAFMAVPVGMSLYFSLTDYPLLEPAVFVGAENYLDLARDPVFGRVVWNTALYAAVTIPLGTAVSIALAVALNRRPRGVGLFRAAIFAPSLVPVAASAMVWLWLFNGELGLVNTVLDAVLAPWGGRGPDWLGHRRWAMTALILLSLWSVGPAVVIYLAALRGVPEELLEAAALDGMGPWRRLRHVTLPLISPVILFNVVIALIGAWQFFALPFIMTNGGPDRATYFYSMYLYDAAFTYGRMGYASALAWVQLVIVLAVTGLTLRVSRRLVFERGAAR